MILFSVALAVDYALLMPNRMARNLTWALQREFDFVLPCVHLCGYHIVDGKSIENKIN